MTYMFDTGVDSSETQNPINVAMQSTGGRKIQPLVAEKTKSLEVSRLTTGASVISTNVNGSSPLHAIHLKWFVDRTKVGSSFGAVMFALQDMPRSLSINWIQAES